MYAYLHYSLIALCHSILKFGISSNLRLEFPTVSLLRTMMRLYSLPNILNKIVRKRHVGNMLRIVVQLGIS